MTYVTYWAFIRQLVAQMILCLDFLRKSDSYGYNAEGKIGREISTYFSLKVHAILYAIARETIRTKRRVNSTWSLPNEKNTVNSANNDPTPAEIERQKNAFIEKLIEIVRKQEKPPKPETPKGQDQS